MISVIIPTLNEEKALPLTLAHVMVQPGDYDVVVVDGGSTDRTCDIANKERRLRLLHAPKGRASQMNRGAKEATASGSCSSTRIRSCRPVRWLGSTPWNRIVRFKPEDSSIDSRDMTGDCVCCRL